MPNVDVTNYGIQNRDKLLSDIAEGLKELRVEVDRRRSQGQFGARYPDLDAVQVQFTGEHVGVLWAGSLESALDVLANNLYWDEQGDWSGATHAKVKTV